jgi:hypothetical protein
VFVIAGDLPLVSVSVPALVDVVASVTFEPLLTVSVALLVELVANVRFAALPDPTFNVELSTPPIVIVFECVTVFPLVSDRVPALVLDVARVTFDPLFTVSVAAVVELVASVILLIVLLNVCADANVLVVSILALVASAVAMLSNSAPISVPLTNFAGFPVVSASFAAKSVVLVYVVIAAHPL